MTVAQIMQDCPRKGVVIVEKIPDGFEDTYLFMFWFSEYDRALKKLKELNDDKYDLISCETGRLLTWVI